MCVLSPLHVQLYPTILLENSTQAHNNKVLEPYSVGISMLEYILGIFSISSPSIFRFGLNI